MTTQSTARIEFPSYTPKQSEIWNYYCDAEPGEITIIGWGGSYGGGKTSGAVRFAMNLMGMYPGINILITRNTLQNLKNPGGTIDQFKALIPANGLHVRHGGIVSSMLTDNRPILGIRLPGWPESVESRVFFRGADDDTFFQSAEIGAVIAEEAPSINEKSWTYAISRLRQTLPDGTVPKYLALAVSNPAISWWKEWFIDNLAEKQEKFKGAGRVMFFQSKQSDNPYLPENYETILRATLDDEEIAANVEGRFDVFPGRVYTNFSPEIHGVKQEDWHRGAELVPGLTRWNPATTKSIVINGQRLVIPRFKYAVGGLDFGGEQKRAHFSAGAVCIVTGTGRDFLVDVFADNGPGVHRRQVQWMREMESALAGASGNQDFRIDWAADGTQPTFISLMRDEGFHIRKNNGSNDAWMQDAQYNKARFMIQPDGFPLSMFLDTKRNREWAREVAQYRLEMKPGPNGVMRNQPIRKDDDRYDAWRYAHERLQTLQRQLNPDKRVVLGNEAQPKEGKKDPLSEFDRFIIENKERILREKAARVVSVARQKVRVPA